MLTRSRDTHPEAERVLIDLLSKTLPERRHLFAKKAFVRSNGAPEGAKKRIKASQ